MKWFQVVLGRFILDISSLKGLSGIGTGCPGKQLRYHPWRYLKNVYMWCLGTLFCGGLGSARLMVGPDDLKGLFQSKQFCDSMISYASGRRQERYW